MTRKREPSGHKGRGVDYNKLALELRNGPRAGATPQYTEPGDGPYDGDLAEADRHSDIINTKQLRCGAADQAARATLAAMHACIGQADLGVGFKPREIDEIGVLLFAFPQSLLAHRRSATFSRMSPSAARRTILDRAGLSPNPIEVEAIGMMQFTIPRTSGRKRALRLTVSDPSGRINEARGKVAKAVSEIADVEIKPLPSLDCLTMVVGALEDGRYGARQGVVRHLGEELAGQTFNLQFPTS